MKKSISALVAAVLVTSLLGGVMFLIGRDAFGTSTAKAEAAAAATPVTADTVAQYEQIIKQYEARETQYQAQIAQATDQINTANQQIQQFQSVLQQLQNTGLITVGGDGNITVNQNNQPDFFPRHGGDH